MPKSVSGSIWFSTGRVMIGDDILQEICVPEPQDDRTLTECIHVDAHFGLLRTAAAYKLGVYVNDTNTRLIISNLDEDTYEECRLTTMHAPRSSWVKLCDQSVLPGLRGTRSDLFLARGAWTYEIFFEGPVYVDARFKEASIGPDYRQRMTDFYVSPSNVMSTMIHAYPILFHDAYPRPKEPAVDWNDDMDIDMKLGEIKNWLNSIKHINDAGAETIARSIQPSDAAIARTTIQFFTHLQTWHPNGCPAIWPSTDMNIYELPAKDDLVWMAAAQQENLYIPFQSILEELPSMSTLSEEWRDLFRFVYQLLSEHAVDETVRNGSKKIYSALI